MLKEKKFPWDAFCIALLLGFAIYLIADFNVGQDIL